MPKIFLSYRREDSAGHAGRLYDHLRQHFGAGNLFMDIDTLEPGVDFVSAVERTLSECDVLLAVIGPRWLSMPDRSGTRRLDREDDFVRLEIETALGRNIRTIPVLVQSAQMPSGEELPPSLASLTRRHAIELTDVRWAYDVGRLLDTLKRIPEHASPSLNETGRHIEPSEPAALRESSVADAQKSPQRAEVGPHPAAATPTVTAHVSEGPVAVRIQPAPTFDVRTGPRPVLSVVGVVVAVASAAFVVFSSIYGAKRADIAVQTYQDFMSELHRVVMPVSILYFLSCFVFFAAVTARSPRKRIWQGLFAMGVCIVMFGWSLLLSSRISFNEVFMAWIAAGIVLGALALPQVARFVSAERSGRI